MDRAERVARELMDDLARWSDLDLTDKEETRFIAILRREFQAVWEEAAAVCEGEAVCWERAFPDEGPAAEARLCADKIRARAKEEESRQESGQSGAIRPESGRDSGHGVRVGIDQSGNESGHSCPIDPVILASCRNRAMDVAWGPEGDGLTCGQARELLEREYGAEVCRVALLPGHEEEEACR